MASNSVIPPFPIYSDVDGDPLENGYIYIGASGLNPEVSPKNIYWDDALTVPIAQPVRTIGGYPSNAGTPGMIYTDGDYSITIKNKNGTFIYSSLSKTFKIDVDRFNIDSIADLSTVDPLVTDTVNVRGYYTPNDGGGGIFNYDATQSAVNNGGTIINGWVRQYTGSIYTDWFGPDKTGVSDTSVSLQNAIDTKEDIVFSDGIYRLESPLEFGGIDVVNSEPMQTVSKENSEGFAEFKVANNIAAIRFRVTQAQIEAQVKGTKFNILGFLITQVATFSSDGIVINSCFHASIKNCNISGMGGLGINIPNDSQGAVVNSDYFASAYMLIEGNTISSCAGGIHNNQYSSSHIKIYKNRVFNSTTSPAIQSIASLTDISYNSVSGNDAGGIAVVRLVDGTATAYNANVSYNEIQDNGSYGIKLGVSGVTGTGNRILTVADATTKQFKEDYGIWVSNQYIGDPSNININDTFFRFDGSVDATTVFECVRIDDTVASINNVIEDCTFPSAIDTYTSVVKYNFPARYRNIAFENGIGTASGKQEQIGSKQIASVKVANTVTVSTSEILLGLNSIISSSGATFTSSLSDIYNGTTQEFTCPHKGVLKIQGTVKAKILVANTLTINIKVNGVVDTAAITLFPTVADYQDINISSVINVNSGDAVTVYGISSVVNGLQVRGAVDIVNFEML